MAKYSAIQKNKVFKKLKKINILTEKDILNLKVSKLNEIENLTIKDIEIILQMQEAIENKKMLEFFTDI